MRFYCLGTNHPGWQPGFKKRRPGTDWKIECALLGGNEIDFVEDGSFKRRSETVNEALFAGEFEAAFAADTSEGPIALYNVGESCLP